MTLPQDVIAIINEYRYGLEHYDKFKLVLCELRYKHFFQHVCRLYTIVYEVNVSDL